MSQPKKKSSFLPFDWDIFVPSESLDCFPCCCAMAARYWKRHKPDLPFPTDLETWMVFAGYTAGVSQRGASIRRIFVNIPSKEIEPGLSTEEPTEIDLEVGKEELTKVEKFGLVIEQRTVKGVADLQCFLDASPPIPTILIVDVRFMEVNVVGPSHAVLLESIDLGKEKLFVIDPSKTKLREATSWDLNRFKKSWPLTQNLSILVYPPDMIGISSGDFRGVEKQETLERFQRRV